MAKSDDKPEKPEKPDKGESKKRRKTLDEFDVELEELVESAREIIQKKEDPESQAESDDKKSAQTAKWMKIRQKLKNNLKK